MLRSEKGYQILEESNQYILEVKVNEEMKNGWEPLGGVTAYMVGYATYYCQAMIKKPR